MARKLKKTKGRGRASIKITKKKGHSTRQPIYASEIREKQQRRLFYQNTGQRGPGTY